MIRALIYVFLGVVFLRHLYLFVASSAGLEGFYPPLIIHVFIILSAIFYKSKLIKEVSNHSLEAKKKSSYFFYLPSILWIFCIILIVLANKENSVEPKDMYSFFKQLFWIALLVPIVEEIVFRAIFGGLFRKKYGSYLGSYASILLFCLVHTNFSLFNLVGILQLSLGVCLLGITCELLYVLSGRIYTAILFHMCANASGVIFLYFCPSLLKKLELFYH